MRKNICANIPQDFSYLVLQYFGSRNFNNCSRPICQIPLFFEAWIYYSPPERICFPFTFILHFSLNVDAVGVFIATFRDFHSRKNMFDSSCTPAKFHDQFNLLEPEFFFFNFSTPVYKMWIMQEPNTLKLWNKLHFEEKNTESISSSSVICQTTGPKPLVKRFLHIVLSRASSFNSQYPLLSLRSSSNFLLLLPCLLVTSICPFIFPSITCFRRHFLSKMWPIQLAFRFIISCRIFLSSLTLSNTSSFLIRSVHLIFSILLQHHISKLFRCSLSDIVQMIKNEEPLKMHFIYGFETKNIRLLLRNTSNDILGAYCHNQNTSKAHSTVRKAGSILWANAECGQPQPGRYFGRTGAKPTYNCLQSVHEDCHCTNSRKDFVRWWFSSVLPPKNTLSVIYNAVTLNNHGYQFYLPYSLRISLYLHVMIPTKQRTVTVICRKINMRYYRVVSNRSLRKSTE